MDLTADGEISGMTYKYSPAWTPVPRTEVESGFAQAGYGVVNVDPVVSASIVLQVQPSAVYDSTGQSGEDIATSMAQMFGVVDAAASVTTFDGIDG